MFLFCYLPREPEEREPPDELELFDERVLPLPREPLPLLLDTLLWLLFVPPLTDDCGCPCALGRCCEGCTLLLFAPLSRCGATLLRDVLLLREPRIVLLLLP